MLSWQSELCDGLTGFSVMGAKTLLPRFLRQQPGEQGSLFSAKIEYGYTSKSDFTYPCKGDPDKHWHWHWHSPRCVSTGSPRLWELASIFWPRLSSKILPSRGEHGKRGYSVWVVGTNVFFFFSRMQKTNKSSENCTHHLAFGFSPYPKGTDILVALAPS